MALEKDTRPPTSPIKMTLNANYLLDSPKPLYIYIYIYIIDKSKTRTHHQEI